MKLQYKKGDATRPVTITKGAKIIIPHICNDLGAWGAGFVLALSKRWTQPELHYRGLPAYQLGKCYLVDVEDDITVANMIAQHGFHSFDNKVPFRYDDMMTALWFIRDTIMDDVDNTYEIHAPKFGAGLGGGNWEEIEKGIKHVFEDNDFDIVIYEY